MQIENVNCLSYALVALGILDPEEYVDPVQQYYAVRTLFEYADRTKPSDVVVLESSGAVTTLWDIAVIDKNDPQFVTHRLDYGREIDRENLATAFGSIMWRVDGRRTNLVNLRLIQPPAEKIKATDIPIH